MTQPEVSPHVDKIDGAARESGETRNRVSDVILTVLDQSQDQAAIKRRSTHTTAFEDVRTVRRAWWRDSGAGGTAQQRQQRRQQRMQQRMQQRVRAPLVVGSWAWSQHVVGREEL